MEQTLFSQSSPVTAQRSKKRRLSSKRLEGEVSNRRRLDNFLDSFESPHSPVTAQPSRKRRWLSKSKVIKWKKDYQWKKDYKYKKTIKKPSRDRVEVHQIRVDVASYPEFRSLHQKYVTQKAAPVSFNVSDDLDSESYGKILKDLLDSNFSKEVLRRDKIECPRANHHPEPIIPCCTTLEEIKKVYGVMGRFWNPTICLPPKDDSPEINKLYAEISEFIEYVGLRPVLIPLDSIAESPQQ